MQRATIGFPEYSRELVFSEVDAMDPHWANDYPVTQMGNYELPRVARSTTLEPKFIASLPEPRLVQMFGFCGHNLTGSAQYRVRMYRDEAQTILEYDSGQQNVWPIIYGWETRDFYTPNFWTGQYTPAESEGQYPSRIIKLPRSYFVASILVEIFDGNNESGAIDIGYFGLSAAWEVGLNPSYGAQFGLEINDLVTRSASGSDYIEARPKARRFIGSIDLMRMQELKEKAYEMQRQLGKNIPFMWVPFPDDKVNEVRDSYLARLEALGLFTYAMHNRGSVPLNLREVI